MFTFAFPLFLAGAALTAVPLILHFLRRRISKVQDFPSLYFLRQTVSRRKTRNDLRSWIVFLLRALALICLAAAFAWPRFDTPDAAPEEASVFILDASFSTANPEFQSQLGELLGKQLSAVSVERPAVGMIATDRMTVSGDFVSDKSVLGDFFRSFGKPRPFSCDFSTALYRADRILAGIRAGKRRIVIFTDRQRLPWNRMPEKPFLHYADEVVILPETIREPANARILSADRFRG